MSASDRTKLPVTAVVLSTFNQPHLLRRVLAAYSVQDDAAFRMVIADDGSGKETRDVIEEARAKWFPTLLHVWHEDDGFRKCMILNKAIVAAQEEYMIFSDGDCIPRPDFVRTHREFARPGRFLSGGYLLLPAAVSESITMEDVLGGRMVAMKPLRERGLAWSLRTWSRLLPRGVCTSLLDALNPAKRNWNGHNASGWRKDLVAACGFDERMAWWGEDREFGMRLTNAGVRGIHIRYQAPVVHLDHSRGYVRPEAFAKNAEIRAQTKRTKRTRTEYGIKSG